MINIVIAVHDVQYVVEVNKISAMHIENTHKN